jgi:hypothetical protein
LLLRSSAVSSTATKTPGSLSFSVPWTPKAIARKILPQPALPQPSVGRPFGNPLPLMSSSPQMPVGDFGSRCGASL